MATSKTLAPTNVTISIPAMTDAPDQSVNSNCIDKLGDAVNTLNSQISTAALANSQGVLAYAESLSAPTYKFITLPGSGYSNSDLPANIFKWGSGLIIKRLSQNIIVILFANGVKPTINIYNESAWSGWKDFMWSNYS